MYIMRILRASIRAILHGMERVTVIQWGLIPNTNGDYTLTFPLSFLEKPKFAVSSEWDSSVYTDSEFYITQTDVNHATPTQLRIVGRNMKNGRVTKLGSACVWLAVGR